jgi:hypothetical protein
MHELAESKSMSESGSARLNGPHACILSDVLVLVQSIFGRFAFFQIDRKFDKKEHNWLKRGDRAVAGSLGCDMFMKDCQRSRGLANGDEFLRSLCQTVSKRSQSPVHAR